MSIQIKLISQKFQRQNKMNKAALPVEARIESERIKQPVQTLVNNYHNIMSPSFVFSQKVTIINCKFDYFWSSK